MLNFFTYIADKLNLFFDLSLGWTLKLGPLYGIIIVSFVITLITTVVYKYATDQEALKKLKDENKELQAKMKEHKENPAKIKEINSELAKKSMESLKHQIKPMIITFLPLFLIFGWLRKSYAGSTENIFLIFGWFGTYFVFSFIFSIVLRKVLKVY